MVYYSCCNRLNSRNNRLLFFFILLISSFSVFSSDEYRNHRNISYKLVEAPQFVHYDQRIKTPFIFNDEYLFGFKAVSYAIVPYKAAKIATLPLSSVGLFAFGLSENLMATQSLLKLRNVNKRSDEFTVDKSLHLSKYFDEDGFHLFWQYLRKIQTVSDKNLSHHNIAILDKNNRISKKITPQIMRDFTKNFILEYKRKNQLVSNKYLIEDYEEFENDISHFLREFGFITFSMKTLQTLAVEFNEDIEESEIKLMKYLKKSGLLTTNYRLRDYKDFFQRKQVDSNIMSLYLKKFGLQSESLMRDILHDFGFIHDLDIQNLSKNNQIISRIYELNTEVTQGHIKNQFHDSLKSKVKKYIETEPQLDRILDEVILETVLNQNEIKDYILKNKLKLEKDSDDKATVLRLLYLEKFPENHNFYSLDK